MKVRGNGGQGLVDAEAVMRADAALILRARHVEGPLIRDLREVVGAFVGFLVSVIRHGLLQHPLPNTSLLSSTIHR